MGLPQREARSQPAQSYDTGTANICNIVSMHVPSFSYPRTLDIFNLFRTFRNGTFHHAKSPPELATFDSNHDLPCGLFCEPSHKTM
jgi:hypothetical protein